jgi:hypothetical protein
MDGPKISKGEASMNALEFQISFLRSQIQTEMDREECHSASFTKFGRFLSEIGWTCGETRCCSARAALSTLKNMRCKAFKDRTLTAMEELFHLCASQVDVAGRIHRARLLREGVEIIEFTGNERDVSQAMSYFKSMFPESEDVWTTEWYAVT